MDSLLVSVLLQLPFPSAPRCCSYPFLYNKLSPSAVGNSFSEYAYIPTFLSLYSHFVI